ncbi:MAG: hypothetical protein ACR2GL_03465 [Thermoleophilaceae bacterium]
MKKDLRPVHDIVACDACGRTILKGERTEPYLAPGGRRHSVCELCFVRAEHEGWIRESAHDQLPSRSPRPPQRRAFFARRRRPEADALNGDSGDDRHEALADEEPGVEQGAPNGEPGFEPAQGAQRGERPQSPRHVRGVPTTAEVKVERALELFNASEHQRTVAGLTRSLGQPWVTALPAPTAPSTVTVIVAWDISWYRYRVDLGDAAEPVALEGKGDELDDIDDSLRKWNATLGADGQLATGAPGE